MRYSINVPVDKTPTPLGLIAETMIFCHNKFDEWWSRVMVDRVHARRQLTTSDIKTEGHLGSGVRWLRRFVVGKFIHEATHAEALAGEGDALSEFYTVPSLLCSDCRAGR